MNTTLLFEGERKMDDGLKENERLIGRLKEKRDVMQEKANTECLNSVSQSIS